MSEEPSFRRALTLTEIGVIVSLLGTTATGVFTLGFLYGQLNRNTADIAEIKPKVDEVQKRIERIDAGVQILLEQAGAAK